MAKILIASDLRDEQYVKDDLPTEIKAAGHESEAVYPLENLASAARVMCLAGGGVDMAIVVHSAGSSAGTERPYKAVNQLRSLDDRFTFRNAVKAKSLPVLVIAKGADLPSIEHDQLTSLGWVAIYDPDTATEAVVSEAKGIIFKWRTDLLRELECVGYAVTISGGGVLEVRPTFKKAEVEGEILAAKTTPGSLSAAGYLVVSSDVFKEAASYRQLAYLIEHFRIIAKKRKTKPEEVFQDFFTRHPSLLFSEMAQLWPKLRLGLPEDPTKWLEPDFVVKPSVAPQLGSKWTVLDVKLPDVRLRSSGTFHPTYSSKLFKAIQQLANYRDYFGRVDAQATLVKAFGIQPRNPKLAVLIGRKATMDVADALDHVGKTMPMLNVDIITYDDVLESQSLRIAQALEWINSVT